MVEYTLLEKMKCVFDLIVASPLFLVLLLGIVLMSIDSLYISKQDTKTKIIYLGLSLVVIALFMYANLEALGRIVDTLAKNIVTLIYFPTMLEYVATLVISLIILGFSIFNSKMKTWVKRINVGFFTINAFLFCLMLDQLAGTEVDLTNKISIYTNSHLMILLELSLAVFAIWLIGLILYQIIKRITPRETEATPIDLVQQMTFDEPIDMPKLKNEVVRPELMPEPVTYHYLNETNVSDMFTLDEYKQMRAMLAVIQESSKN